MKVYVYPADLYGCGHYRLIWPALAAQALDDPDLSVRVVNPLNHENTLFGLIAYNDHHGNVRDVSCPTDADVIILQRTTQPQLTQAIPILREKGVAVVIDVDDDLTAIHPSNPAWAAMHPRTNIHDRFGNKHSWTNVSIACRAATLTTVSTPALARRYSGVYGSTVLENCVPESYLAVPHVDSTTIGWAGTVHSHPDDLQQLGPTIRQFMDDGVDFMVVGDSEGSARPLNLREDAPCTGPIDFEHWISAVSQIGVGIAPLADTKFNAAKSWLKPLEYSVAGVPWIASPRVEYARFQAFGAGLLANRPRDWRSAISRVLRSSDLRSELAGRGREVAARWTIERHVERWVTTWRSAVEFEAGARRTRPAHSTSTAPVPR